MNLCLLIGEQNQQAGILVSPLLGWTFQGLTGTSQPGNSINVAVFMIVCVRQESLPLFHLLSFGLLLLLLRGLCQVQADLMVEEKNLHAGLARVLLLTSRGVEAPTPLLGER